MDESKTVGTCQDLGQSSNKPHISKNPFDNQRPSEENIQRREAVREAYKVLYAHLETLRPTRERSVAITKLEESAHWAIKSLVFNEQ